MFHRTLPVCLAALALAALTAVPAQAEKATYEIDAGHSAVVFSVNHLGFGTAWGRFNEMSGNFTHDSANPAASTVNFTINAESVDTAHAKRDQHLRSPDFFDVKQYPEITFKSTSVKPIAAGDLEITGDITFHGVKKSITARADLVGAGKDPWGNYRMGYDITFTLQRSDFGVTYMEGGLGEDVKVHVSVEGVRK